MTRPLSHLSVFVLALCSWVASASFADADEPTKRDATATTIESSVSLDMQLAKARLNLAEIELQNALATNNRARVYSTVTIKLLQRNVAIAKVRLDALSRTGEESLHAAHLRELESALKTTELRWKSAVGLRERLPDSMDAAHVKALRLRTEVARLALARAREPVHVASPLGHMQWQLEQLRQEMLELTLRVEELSNRK